MRPMQTIRIFRFLLTPQKEFLQIWGEPPQNVWIYYIRLLIFCGIASYLLQLFLGISALPFFTPFIGIEIGGSLSPFLLTLGMGILLALASIIIAHPLTKLSGSTGGIQRTSQALLYGFTPSLLLGWIPILGTAMLLWSYLLQIIGLRELQNTNTLQSTLIIIVCRPLIDALMILLWIGI